MINTCMISSGSFQSDVYWNMFIFNEIKIRPWQMKMWSTDPVDRIIFIESQIMTLYWRLESLVRIYQLDQCISIIHLISMLFCKISTAINSFLKNIFIVFRNYFSVFSFLPCTLFPSVSPIWNFFFHLKLWETVFLKAHFIIFLKVKWYMTRVFTSW